MEALPIFPMMAPAFRTSTLSYDNIPNFNFRLKMKEHILLTFNTDPHEYDEAFDELAHLKFEANIPSASVEQICKLKRYYGQLCMMQKRFPMGAGDQLETPFTWNDGLVDLRSSHSEVTINDIEFEKASVMFNIGACHAQFATEQTRDTQDSIKAAFMHFQYAAFAFEQLNTFRNCEMFYPSVDLDSNVIAFYYKVMIAQAQECLVQKSLLDNRSAIVIAKLSLWLQESFESATKIVDDWIVNIPESVQKYYEKFCRLKADMYGVIAYMSLGDHAEKEEKKMGWRLQYYNIAAKYMESVSMDRKTKENYPELMVTASFLFDVISAKQKNAEKENDFIYHDRVPKQEEAIGAAKKDGAMCKVKTLAFDPLDASVCGEDIFAALLPPEIIESNKNYGAQKAEIFKRNVEVIQSYDANLDVMLERAEFDNLRFMLNEGKDLQAMFEIPDELMKRNADMTAYSDCIPNLIERLRESSGTATVADAKLNTLISKLSAIDLPRLKSDEGFILISKELNKLSDHLSQAKSNNTALNKAIASHTPNLQLLSLPCNEMWQKILPEWKAPKEMSPEEVQLRKMVEKVLEMRTQRHTLLAQIEATMKQDDISKKLMGTNEERANLIMQEELTKYAKYEQLINLNVQAQENIVRAFADANADFCAERIEMQRAKTAYDQKVAELIGSYDVYRDVTRKIEEGEQFYRQLMARCDQFAIPVHAMDEQYRAEIEKKERAQKEAEQRMHQFRMNREAQDAMMDFGGGGAAPPRAMGPISTRHSPMAPPPGPSAGRAPRLGDYLESYRARKGAQPPITTPQFQPMHQQHEPQGPPSPTPSSICDFPVSTRGAGASQRMMASPRAPEPPSQYYGAYQQPAPYQQQHPKYPPTNQYQGPPPLAQQASSSPQPQPQPQTFPMYQAAPAQPGFGAVQQGYGGGFASSPLPQQYQQPVFGGAVAPTQNYQAPPQHPQNYAQAHGAPRNFGAYNVPAPAPLQAPIQNFQGHGYGVAQNAQQQYHGALNSNPATPVQAQAPPPPPAPAQNFQGFPQNSQIPQPHGAAQNAPQQYPGALSSNSSTPTPATAHNFQGFPPNSQQHSQIPPTHGAAQIAPQQYPGARSSNSSTPTPAPAAAAAPAQTQNFQILHQNPQNHAQIPPTQAPAPPPAPQPSRFTPTAAAPSPWHATPAELKTPWATTPQYNAPAPAAPQAPPPAQPSARNNVDLLNDLLGDFNMNMNLPQPIQPTMQNLQNLTAPRPDFRQAPPHPDPGKFPPIAAVQPMPQIPQIPQQKNQQAIETPILGKSSPTITELVDPTKFELGEPNVHKLEKRMLHHSIRTNGAPPPLNQADPLNQIDVFGFANQK